MGVTLYCMVFGKLPFTGKSIIQLFDSIRDDAYFEINQVLSIPLKQTQDFWICLQSCIVLSNPSLEKDPSKRIELADLRVFAI